MKMPLPRVSLPLDGSPSYPSLSRGEGEVGVVILSSPRPREKTEQKTGVKMSGAVGIALITSYR
jgi:hypothetical protein